jgi:phosphohistidine phosphatase SixA
MLLLRHASAGNRLESPILDPLRPLDRVGRGQARQLPEALASYAIDRIVSSPQRRCVETVRPLAEARGLEIETRDELVPDARLEDIRALLDGLPAESLVCTHREVIERLFCGAVACEKGGSWALERHASQWLPMEYLPPSAPAGHASRVPAAVRNR